MIICPFCGKETSGEEEYCACCGKSITAAPSSDKAFRCPACGADIESDSAFCEKCGSPISPPAAPKDLQVRDTEVRSAKSVKTTSRMPDYVRYIDLLIGIVFIIIGITRITSAGTTISSTSFGGDFYTYTYKGIVAITELLARIDVTLGWILIAIGASIGTRVFRR